MVDYDPEAKALVLKKWAAGDRRSQAYAMQVVRRMDPSIKKKDDCLKLIDRWQKEARGEPLEDQELNTFIEETVAKAMTFSEFDLAALRLLGDSPLAITQEIEGRLANVTEFVRLYFALLLSGVNVTTVLRDVMISMNDVCHDDNGGWSGVLYPKIVEAVHNSRQFIEQSDVVKDMSRML